jgi:hypothetical protein
LPFIPSQSPVACHKQTFPLAQAPSHAALGEQKRDASGFSSLAEGQHSAYSVATGHAEPIYYFFFFVFYWILRIYPIHLRIPYSESYKKRLLGITVAFPVGITVVFSVANTYYFLTRYKRVCYAKFVYSNRFRALLFCGKGGIPPPNPSRVKLD